MIKNEDLKPCPFCGNPGELLNTDKYTEFDCNCVLSDDSFNNCTTTETWQNAYCWKELQKERERSKRLFVAVQKALQERILGHPQVEAGAMEDLEVELAAYKSSEESGEK